MGMTVKKIPLHVSVRRKLLETPGGWLPPERELCQKLGVSRCTLRKAIDQLIKSGLITSYPRKGNQVSSVKVPPIIGIILGGGDFSPHVPSITMLGGELDVLEAASCHVQIINLRQNVEKELGKHDLDGLLWNDPPPALFPLISRMIEKGDPPLVVPALMFGGANDRLVLPYQIVSMDFVANGRQRANYFLNKGVDRVAYLGDDADAPTLKAFVSTLEAAGRKFDWEWHIRDVADIPERLPELLAKGEIAGIVANGGANRFEVLFQTLEEQAATENVEILPDLVPGMPELLRRHPKVRVNAVNEIPKRCVGETAAKVLLRQIRTGSASPLILINTRLLPVEQIMRQENE